MFFFHPVLSVSVILMCDFTYAVKDLDEISRVFLHPELIKQQKVKFAMVKS